MPYISVIIANYNHAQHLERLYHSIENSGLLDYEVIFVDDSSTDDSVEILKKMDLRLYSLTENRGPAYARNLGVEYSSGEIILFCDSDIEIVANSLRGVEDRFRDCEVDTLVGDLAFPPLLNTRSGFFYLYEEWENIRYGGLRTGKTRYWSTTLGFIRKDLFIQMGGFDTNYKGADIEDLVFAFQLPSETKSYFDSEIKFHHFYPSLLIILKKLFIRSFQFAQVKVDLSDQPLFDNQHRKLGYMISLLLLFAFVDIRLFIPAFLLKVFHHRTLVKKIWKDRGFLFLSYCIAAMYASSFVAVMGYGIGKFQRKISMS